MSQPLLGKTVVAQMERELKEQVSALSHAPSVGIIYVGTNPVIEHFISMKAKFAEKIGVRLQVYRLPVTSSTEEVTSEIHERASSHDGMIVQLPLPAGVDTDRVLDAVPLTKDIDMLSSSARQYVASGHTEVLPGVAGAIREFIERTPITLSGKKIVIIGQGKLVGKPVQAWLKTLHIEPVMVSRETNSLRDAISDADIVISGAGAPRLVTADMLKPGVILFDGGTSEVNEKIEGDIAPEAYLQASFYTPVPGGIGPITIAYLFKNLVTLMNR